jgi:Anti-sigma-K factor rskA
MDASPAVAMHASSNGSTYASDSEPANRPVSSEPVELPKGQRLSGPVLAALAALAGVAAMVLGTTAFAASLRSDDSDGTQPASASRAAAISFLAKPSTARVHVAGSRGRIVLAVGSAGRGVLVLKGLGAAPQGKSYQAWVTRPKAKVPVSAAVFTGAEALVPLSLAVEPGSVVTITVERAGGAELPTQDPKFVAQPAT